MDQIRTFGAHFLDSTLHHLAMSFLSRILTPLLATTASRRVRCKRCRAKILPLTFDYTGGLCMPCFNTDRYRINHEEVEPFYLKGNYEPPVARRKLKAYEKRGVRYRTAPVTSQIPHEGGPRTISLVRISIHRDDKSKADEYYQPTNAIRNCKAEFRYVCPMDWDDLEPTSEPIARFCQECQQPVFFCATDVESLNHARQGHCIAMPGEDGSGRWLIKVGMPEPLTTEQKAILAAYLLDTAKTEALRDLKDSSRFCPGCGYPWPNEHALAINALTFAAYASDKRRARAKEERLPEARLHLLELMGGWPGAFLAQRRFRHKCSKETFQVVFWLIVLVFQLVAFDSLQDWQYIRAALKHIERASQNHS